MALKPKETMNLVKMIGLIIVVFSFMQTSGSQSNEAMAKRREEFRRDPLPLPQEFDDSAVLDTDKMSRVTDFTILSNDQNGIDRGFWACLDYIRKLSPQEISNRVTPFNFEHLKNKDMMLEVSKEMRGKIIKVRGYFNTNGKDFQLPDNPTQIPRIRQCLIKDSPFFTRELKEGYLVYALDDSMANLHDEVEVEGVYFKIVEYKDQLNKTRWLPAIVAREVKVVEPFTLKAEGPTSWWDENSHMVFGLLFLIGGLSIIVFVKVHKSKQEKFREDVLSKIRDRKNDLNTPDPS